MLARHRLRPPFVGVREEIPKFLFGGMGWEVLVGVQLVGFLTSTNLGEHNRGRTTTPSRKMRPGKGAFAFVA